MNTRLVAAAAGVAGIAGILVAIYLLPSAPTGLEDQSFTVGAFTVNIAEDTDRRFIANVQNNGATLSNAGAFVVKRNFDSGCEPQGIVMANFHLAERDGVTVAQPDTLIEGSTVTIDSRESGINRIPVGPDIETMAYILRLEPDSVQVAGLLQEIPIQQQNQVELFEGCLENAGKGYPLIIRVLNPQSNSTNYFTIRDTAGNTYETSLRVSPDLPDDVAEFFWPDQRSNWMAANFTRLGGPLPQYSEPPLLSIKLATESEGVAHEYEHNIVLRPDDLREYSFDYVDKITGKIVPAYPKYWEIQVDLHDGSMS